MSHAFSLNRSGKIIVSFRDIPGCEAFKKCYRQQIDDEPIPLPSRRRTGEQLIAVPSDMAAKAAFALTFRTCDLSRLA